MHGQPTDAWSDGRSLRSLGGRARLVAAAVGVLLFGLFALSAGRALADGWMPTGDEALLALRAQDVLDGHPPLVGQPSTSRINGGNATSHPGPIQAWLFAVPVRLLGPAAGMRMAAAAVNGGAVLLAVWVVLRRAGPSMALAAATVLAMVVWAQGTEVASDPLSSNQGAYPALALAFLTWALLAGDIRLAPVAVLVASFAAQQHLNQVIPVVLLVLVAATGATWHVWRRPRVAQPRPSDDGHPRLVDLRWPLIAAVVGIISALPVLVQEVTGDPGNITAVIRYAGEGDRATLGAARGITQVLRATGSPSLLIHHNLAGYDAQNNLARPGVVAGVAVLVLLVLMAIRDRRRERARLAIIALALSVAGFFNGTNLLKAESIRVNQYRWMWVVCALSWLALGWWLAERLGPVVRRALGAAARRAVPVTVGLVVAFLLVGDAGAFAVRSRDDGARFDNSFALVRRLRPAVRAETRGGGTWIVAIAGTLAYNVVAPALVLDLASRGVDVDVASTEPDVHQFYGRQRLHRSGPIRGVLLVRSSLGAVKPAPGRLVRAGRLNPELNRLIDQVAPTLLGQPVRQAPDGAAERALQGLGLDGLERYFGLLRAERLGSDPNALRDGTILRGMDRGMLSSPQLPRSTLRRMVRLLDRGGEPQLFGEDSVEVWRMSEKQLATLGSFR